MKKRTLFENEKYKLSEKKEDATRFSSDFSMVWFGAFTELAIALKPWQLRVFLEIAKMNGHENRSSINAPKIAYCTRIAINHVHTELKVLKGLDALREADGYYLINPDSLWRGNQRDYWKFRNECKKTKHLRKIVTRLR